MKCCVCNADQPHEDDLVAHISAHHVGYIPFECRLCPNVFMPTKSVIKQHFRKVHPDTLPTTVCSYNELKSTKLARLVGESRRMNAIMNVGSGRNVVIVGGDESRNWGRGEAMASVIAEMEAIDSRRPRMATDVDATLLSRTWALATNRSRSVNNSTPTSSRQSLPSFITKSTAATCPRCNNGIYFVCPCSVFKPEPPASHSDLASTSTPTTLQGDSPATFIQQRNRKQSSIGNGGNSGFCLECNCRITNKTTHVWQRHMPEKRFGCPEPDCSNSYAAMQEIKSHVRYAHNRADFIDRTNELFPKYKQLKQALFADVPPSTRKGALELTLGAINLTLGAAIDPAMLSLSDARTGTRGIGNDEAVTTSTNGEQPEEDAVMRKRISTKETAATALIEGESPKKKGRRIRDTAAICSICYEMICKGSQAADIHIWNRHMPTPRYHCRLCPLKFARSSHIKRHVLTHRSSGDDGDAIYDTKAEQTAEFLAIKRTAFGLKYIVNCSAFDVGAYRQNSEGVKPSNISISSKNTNSETYTKKMQCFLCKVEKRDEDNLTAHIGAYHVSYIPYECGLCPNVFLATHTVIKQHFALVHPNAELTTIYTYNEEKSKKLKELLDQSRLLQASPNTQALPAIEVSYSAVSDCNSTESASLESKSEVLLSEKDNKLFNLILQSISSPEIQNEIGKPHSQSHSNNGNMAPINNAEKYRLANQVMINSKDRSSSHQNSVNRNKSACQKCNKKVDLACPCQLDKSKCDSTITDEERSDLEVKTPKTRRPKRSSSVTKTDTPNASGGFCQACTRFVTNKVTHIWQRHMAEKRFSCPAPDCKNSYAAMQEIKSHVWYQHGSADFTDRTKELSAQYKHLKTALFSTNSDSTTAVEADAGELKITTEIPSENRSRKRSTPGACAICDEALSKGGEALSAHIWNRHMMAPRYHCRRCPLKFARSSHMKRHVLTHRDSTGEDIVTDTMIELKQEFIRVQKAALVMYNEMPL